jgi:integrase
MNFVEPIRDRKKITQIKNQLRGQRRYRDLLLFVVGINTALRISDLLQLRVVHLMDDQQHIKRRFWIREQKRGKRHEITINKSIREVFAEFLEEYSGIANNPKHFLFSTPRSITLHYQLSVVKLGNLSLPFAGKLGFAEISAPIV